MESRPNIKILAQLQLSKTAIIKMARVRKKRGHFLKKNKKRGNGYAYSARIYTNIRKVFQY